MIEKEKIMAADRTKLANKKAMRSLTKNVNKDTFSRCKNQLIKKGDKEH